MHYESAPPFRKVEAGRLLMLSVNPRSECESGE
jgi:hypothetical protein